VGKIKVVGGVIVTPYDFGSEGKKVIIIGEVIKVE